MEPLIVTTGCVFVHQVWRIFVLSVLNPILRAHEVVVKAGVTDSYGENDEKKKTRPIWAKSFADNLINFAEET